MTEPAHIYVDPLFVAESSNAQAFAHGERNGHQWCHMFVGDEEHLPLLHSFAAMLGLKRSYFDPRDGDIGHYDLTPGMRAKAIRLGAKSVTREEAVAIWRRNRELKKGTTQ